MNKSILVVDDEPTLLATLRYNLEREGYSVLEAADGEAGLILARAHHPNLVILDVLLPKLDGFEVCRILRKETPVPILMLTARGDEVDKIVGLEIGADDYVTKPFSMRELLARVRAMLRRGESVENDLLESESISSGNLRADLARREISLNGQELPLKPKEFDLIVFFLRNRGRVFTREQLLSQVWGYDYAGGTRTVDVHVRWVREKIEDEPSSPVRIITVRGSGYRFEG